MFIFSVSLTSAEWWVDDEPPEFIASCSYTRDFDISVL